ncbi:MAG TPA: hypothetical protein VLL52_08580 [Anaerolineae bacterium]|nr:hypothetical protein [Anaerolineae bacterium]
MITHDMVVDEIWPVVADVIMATMAGEGELIPPKLFPRRQAARMYDLYGMHIFELLLKVVLQRTQLGLSRVVETSEGKEVLLEYAWPNEETGAYTAADTVTVHLRPYRGEWRIVGINPAVIDTPLTEAGATRILATHDLSSTAEKLKAEPWLLPVAVYAGALQVHVRPEAIGDDVEKGFLEGMQKRSFGVVSQMNGRSLWRDFKKKIKPTMEYPATWAAAVEFIMGEQGGRKLEAGNVAQEYMASVTLMGERVAEIRKKLGVETFDPRYTPLQEIKVEWE